MHRHLHKSGLCYRTGWNLYTNTCVRAQPDFHRERGSGPLPNTPSTKISNPLLSTSEAWSCELSDRRLTQRETGGWRGGREDGGDLRRGWVVAYKKKKDPFFLSRGLVEWNRCPSFQQRSSRMKSWPSVRFTIHLRNDVMALGGKTDLLQRWDWKYVYALVATCWQSVWEFPVREDRICPSVG